MRLLWLVFALFSYLNVNGQITEIKNWCRLDCEYTAADKVNADLLYLRMQNDSIREVPQETTVKKVPIRIGIVQEDESESSIAEEVVRNIISNLNKSFEDAMFVFYLDEIDLIVSKMKLEDLSKNRFNLYDKFSNKNDKDSIITIYILDHREEFCKEDENGVVCGRTGGFSYILTERTNNIVVSKFDMENSKIVAHEMGHFFGLYHTFEEHLFGKDNFDNKDCHTTGDKICDTPPDPGAFYEIYVNYTKCEMIGLEDDNGNEYKPFLENIMSYYKPCYLTEFSFTTEQIHIMRMASELKMRSIFIRE